MMDFDPQKFPHLVKRPPKKRFPWSPWSWVLLGVLVAVTLLAGWCFGG